MELLLKDFFSPNFALVLWPILSRFFVWSRVVYLLAVFWLGGIELKAAKLDVE